MKKAMICLASALAAISAFASSTPTVAVFARNASSDNSLGAYVAPLEAALAAKLNAAGFSAMSKNVVIDSLEKASKSGNAADASLAKQILASISVSLGKFGGFDNEGDIYSKASMLRVAQMLGADFLLDASILSMASEKRAYSGAMGNTLTTRRVLRTSYSLYGGGVGEGAAGGTVTGEYSFRQTSDIAVNDADTINMLVDSAAANIVADLAKSNEQKPLVAIKPRKVKVKFNCIIEGIVFPAVEVNEKGEYRVANRRFPAVAEGVTVLVDGILAGNAGPGVSDSGACEISQGIHNLRFERSDLEPYERMVNIGENMDTLTVYMRMNESARDRWKKDGAFLESLKAGDKLNDAQIEVLKGIAQAYKSSGFKVDYKTDTKEPINIQQNTSILPQPIVK